MIETSEKGTAVETASPTLFEQIGGEEAVAAVVDIFYGRVLADPDLTHYFEGIDMDRLKAHQRRFIGQALGASAPYSGRTMRAAHEKLGITNAAFDRVVDHLAASLAEAGVDEPTIARIAEAVLPLKADIVTA
ncbi:group 1 truncated hemoglobin [Carbonactinospora thermoautotrophica]|uniref:group I truncated hemoglobin n=1 Tax=Carbonactinospora thermoautotrophica TaxID=1469144 RepID=UPI00226F7AA7|nr:group 1 truncated hemoglobin [Carbonactinospora thermoautotrophica]MCX9193599.1 group 1 truncated hemoglobin [Carbonactinospora thermoautotrophica]